MLEAMRNLALCHLWNELERRRVPPDDLSEWFREKRRTDSGALFGFLVESSGKVERFYTLSPDPQDPDVAVLEGADLATLDQPMSRLPYIQTPPNSPDLGPVLKRSLDGKEPKPKPSMLERLLKRLAGELPSAVGDYGREVAETWSRPKLRYGGELHERGKALPVAMELIDEKHTVLFTYRDGGRRFPGDVPEYLGFLERELHERKYVTKKSPPVDGVCSLCTAASTVYPSGCSGAGLNIANVDRPGAFPGVTTDAADLGYPICADCADLLYVFRFCVLPRLTATVAGYQAALVPALHMHGDGLVEAARLFATLAEGFDESPDRAAKFERRVLLRKLAENRAISAIDIVWADFGNGLTDIRGQISEILPSRLREIHELNRRFKWQDLPFAPRSPVEAMTAESRWIPVARSPVGG